MTEATDAQVQALREQFPVNPTTTTNNINSQVQAQVPIIPVNPTTTTNINSQVQAFREQFPVNPTTSQVVENTDITEVPDTEPVITEVNPLLANAFETASINFENNLEKYKETKLPTLPESFTSDLKGEREFLKYKDAITKTDIYGTPEQYREEGIARLIAARDSVADMLQDKNSARSAAAQTMLDANFPLLIIPSVMLALEVGPVTGTIGAAAEIPARWGRIKDSLENDELIAASGTIAWETAMGVLDSLSIVPGSMIAYDLMARTAKKVKGMLGNPDMIPDMINMAGGARLAEVLVRENASKLAAKVANKNSDLRKQFISEWEERNPTLKISSDTGVYDPVLARKSGRAVSVRVMDAQNSTVMGIDNVTEVHPLAHLASDGDELVEPILIPEKFDAIIALAADLRKKNPDAFKDKKTPLIDILFKATVDKSLVSSEELLTILSKYDLSFDDYMLTVVSGGSEAGKVLSKLSQIRRANPSNDLFGDAAERKIRDDADTYHDLFLRIEGMRRGLLVSQLATASRNLSSATIRAPLEGLANVMDNAMWNAANKGGMQGLRSFVPFTDDSAWSTSFRHMRYMFARPDIAEDYVDYILNRPEFAKQFSRMFDGINEIRSISKEKRFDLLNKKLKKQGKKPVERKENDIGEMLMSELENAVLTLNGPNRWQEHLIRRGAFLGEVERLVKREYGIDFMDVINKGDIKELLNDTPKYKPKDARSFVDIITESTKKAMDVTYAKVPEIPVFQKATEFITNSGLTIILPFPRFMFSSMELIGQYAGGGVPTAVRKVQDMLTLGKKESGPLTAKDRERISRNLIGMSAVFAAYMYRSSEDAPKIYKEVKAKDGVVVDVSPQFPMRQFLYMGEAVKRVLDGTFSEKFDVKEFSETFIGVNITKGVGSNIFEEIANLASGQDLSGSARGAKILGGMLGNYFSTWAVPLGQMADLQRIAGERGTVVKNTTTAPVLDKTASFINAFVKPFKSRGLFLSPSEEEDLSPRKFVLQDEKKKISPLTKFLYGVSLTTAQSEEGEYLSDLGFTEWDLASRSDEPSVANFENNLIFKTLPGYISMARSLEKKFRKDYFNPRVTNDVVRDKYSEDLFVITKLKPFLKSSIRTLKADIKKAAVTKSSPFIKMLVQYTSMPRENREAGALLFLQREGRAPDMSNKSKNQTLKDLYKIIVYGKAYKNAYGG